MNPSERELRAAEMLKRSLGELAQDDPELLADMIEGQTGLFEMIDRLLFRLSEIEAHKDGLKQAKAGMAERMSRFELGEERIRTLIARAMEILETTKLERPLATVSMVNRQPGLVVLNEETIPETYFVPQPPKLDRRKLLDAIKNGERFPGAMLDNAKPSLTIRRS